jgi:hypothetical protein
VILMVGNFRGTCFKVLFVSMTVLWCMFVSHILCGSTKAIIQMQLLDV